ncbi:MAG: MarR family transcriptional regulator, partial [Candidatus Helarchaeota archaeon]
MMVTETQLKILDLIYQGNKEIRQITEKMGMSRNAIHYQIRRLEKQELIQKKTLIKVGSVQVGGVDLNPLFLHEIRKLLGIP